MVVDGILSWMKIANPDVDDYDNETFQVTIEVSDTDAAALVEAGGKPRKDNDNLFTIKRPTTWPDGSARDVPKVLDDDAMPISSSNVGNGSTGRVQYKTIEGMWKKKPYKKLDLCAVQVSKLVEYGGVDGDELGAVGDTAGTRDDIPF